VRLQPLGHLSGTAMLRTNTTVHLQYRAHLFDLIENAKMALGAF